MGTYTNILYYNIHIPTYILCACATCWHYKTILTITVISNIIYVSNTATCVDMNSPPN